MQFDKFNLLNFTVPDGFGLSHVLQPLSNYDVTIGRPLGSFKHCGSFPHIVLVVYKKVYKKVHLRLFIR